MEDILLDADVLDMIVAWEPDDFTNSLGDLTEVMTMPAPDAEPEEEMIPGLPTLADQLQEAKTDVNAALDLLASAQNHLSIIEAALTLNSDPVWPDCSL